jgi:hypothetical protein
MFNKRNSFMIYNRIKYILNMIENNITSKKLNKIKKLRIVFISKGYNIKDVNDIDYDIYYDIIDEEEFNMIVNHFKKEGYKCKNQKFKTYSYLKIKLIKEHDLCMIL